jgi:hypothetical protein
MLLSRRPLKSTPETMTGRTNVAIFMDSVRWICECRNSSGVLSEAAESEDCGNAGMTSCGSCRLYQAARCQALVTKPLQTFITSMAFLFTSIKIIDQTAPCSQSGVRKNENIQSRYALLTTYKLNFLYLSSFDEKGR